MPPAMQINDIQYETSFAGSKAERALAQALDIRKFEIEMYWKRATYFWALITVCFAGFGLVHGKEGVGFLPTALACIGLVFSVAWSLVIKGSKQWQENWENHVELLEDQVQGPLYKTVLRRPDPEGLRGHAKQWLTGPGPYSVSNINQLISHFIATVWVVLLVPTLELGTGHPVSVPKLLLVLLSVGCCGLFFWAGRTHLHDHVNKADRRDVGIEPVPPSEAAPVNGRQAAEEMFV